MPRAANTYVTALPDLATSLNTFTVEELKWYSTLLPGPAPTRKGELVAQLSAALTRPDSLQQLWAQLTPQQQLVIAEVVYNQGGRYNAEIIEAKYSGATAPNQPRNYYWAYYGQPDKHPKATPYDLFFAHNYGLGHYIAPDLQERLQAFVPSPPPTTIHSQAESPAGPIKPKRKGPEIEVFVTDTERAVFHDLAATLYLIQQGKVSVSAATRLPTLPTVRQLRARLLVGDTFPDDYERAEDAIRPLALVMLAQGAKWAAPSDTAGTRLELTKSGQALTTGTVQPQDIRDAWDRWLKSDVLDELARIRAIKGQQSKEARLTKPAARREKLMVVLRLCPVGRWVAFDEILRYMRAEGLLPQIERNVHAALRVGSYLDFETSGNDAAKYWDVVIGSYLRAVLWEYAATLGLVEIAYTRPEVSPHDFGGPLYSLDEAYVSRYDGLLALRVTNLGAYVFGLTRTYTPPAPVVPSGPPLLKILPNLDVVITDASRLQPNERTFLDRLGTAQSEDVYHLSRDLLAEGVQHGLTLTQAQDFLAARSGQPADAFPSTVRVFFADLERRLGALREGGRMLVLESDDALLLTELANDPALRALVQVARIGDRAVLLVADDQEPAARRALLKLGYVPQK